VIEARIAIEAEGAALAATRRTPADLRTIRRTLTARGVTGQSVPEHVDADMAFHRAVIAAAHNDVLIQLFDAFLPRLRLAMIDMLKIHPIRSEPCDHDLHQQLADAIVARDPAAAAAASRTHLSALKESFT
jgi:DNA-binding FadR family transcriptional regulator